MVVCRKHAISSVSVELSQDTHEDEILNINLTQIDEAEDDKWTAHLQILSQQVQFRIDTGAKCNTLTLDRYQLLMHIGELKRSKTALRSYSNHILKPVAAVDLVAKHKNCEVSAEFEIVDIAQENVLSGATAEALGLIAHLDSLQLLLKKTN